jgi:hypothetical protein
MPGRLLSEAPHDGAGCEPQWLIDYFEKVLVIVLLHDVRIITKKLQNGRGEFEVGS